MIDILDKHKCCGCNSCVQACPKSCISMLADSEGFLYPKVDVTACVHCCKCERVCPELQSLQEHLPEDVWAATNPDEEVRLSSSSGGVFSAIAEKVLNDGGAVFGAAFADDWSVRHICIERTEDLHLLRGSKYVQSLVGDAFSQCHKLLREGREVLFSGTPCQIAGLRLFLHKDYPNLTTLDFVCHGVPSPKVWQSYLIGVAGKKKTFESISFRSKPDGWKNYCMKLTLHAEVSASCSSSVKNSISTEPFHRNAYMQSFLCNVNLRPSCYACPAKSGRSGSDITLGDFWGIQHIQPSLDDDKGLSLVIPQTEKGEVLFRSLKLDDVTSFPFEQVVEHNISLTTPVTEPVLFRRFFFPYCRTLGFSRAWHLMKMHYFVNHVWKAVWRRVLRK